MRRNEPKPTFQVVPIQQVDVYAAVRQQLFDLIEKGGYAPGDKLPSERRLAEALGVSRVAVREATKVLESMGRVEIRRGAGTFVVHSRRDPVTSALLAGHEIDTGFLTHLINLRAALEVKVTELAAEHATESDLVEIREVLTRNEAEHLSDPELGSLNLLFEAAIARAGGNPLLVTLQRSVHELWVEAWGQLSMTPGDKHELHAEHLVIFDALARRDTAAAVEAMRRHVDRQVEGLGGAEPEASEPEVTSG